MATKSRTGSQSTTGSQLSLFSETTDAELVDNLIEESIDARNDDTHTTWTPDPRTLATPPTDDGRESGQRQSTSTGDLRSPGIDGQPAIRVDGGPEDGLPAGVGDRDGEWAFLPDEEDQPQLSFDPATLDPHQPLRAISA